MPRPNVMPPITWLRASFGLRTRPQSMTATHRTTLARPMASSTSTSQKCAPKDCDTGPSASAPALVTTKFRSSSGIDRRQSATDATGPSPAETLPSVTVSARNPFREG